MQFCPDKCKQSGLLQLFLFKYKSSSKEKHFLALELALDPAYKRCGRKNLFDDMGCSVCAVVMSFMTIHTLLLLFACWAFMIVISGHDNLHLQKGDCTKNGFLVG